jgi:crotonobetainyl-CoA:carnitine CoA-transferase CaiB-like acyl-CoA transferase
VEGLDPPGGKPLPLAGVRVADFSWIVAGPQATRILADLGAEVIRVENESHIDSQRIGAQLGDHPSYNASGVFNNMNRNKLGITANLHHPRGREVVERLIAISDVVIENFSAGVFERLGFGWRRLQVLNPRVIYISVSGFGHKGRDAPYITWGPTAQAVSGCTYMSGLPDQPPAGWGFSYLDHVAGYFGAIAILMALRHRETTGRGQYIDISQVETGMALCGVPMLDYQVNGRVYQRVGNHSRWPPVAPHAVYRCRDHAEGGDRWIAIAAETDDQWLALCDVLDAPELAADPRFASNLRRVENQAALDEALTERTRRFEARELMYLLQARGVPAGVAQNMRDKAEHDPQLAHRGFFQTADHPELGPHRFEGLPVRFSGARWQVRRGAPCLGEHNVDVLTRLLGYSQEEVAALVAEAALA